jgi:protein tyrosine/serine phosphatase
MNRMSSLAAVTVIGNDRTGIVAAVTRVLFDQWCNLEERRRSTVKPPVQNEQPVEMIDLVLEGTGLERVGDDDTLRPMLIDALDDHAL